MPGPPCHLATPPELIPTVTYSALIFTNAIRKNMMKKNFKYMIKSLFILSVIIIIGAFLHSFTRNHGHPN